MKKLLLSAAACLSVPCATFAQVVRPDAGQVLQGTLNKQPAPPAPVSPGVVPRSKADVAAPIAGGPQVVVADVRFEGNTVFAGEKLKGLLADKLGGRYDLAGMKQLAEAVTAYYRQQGYPFAKVIVPVQEFDDGVLKFKVLEGRYANVTPIGEPFVVEGATKFLGRLRPGDLIQSEKLETVMLTLDDLPGVGVAPLVRPGAKVETADLDVGVSLEEKRGGQLSYDNYGNRFTGRNRLRGQYFENSLLQFGDQATIELLATNHEMLLGSLAYDRPLGGDGLRGELSYSNTNYALAEDYAPLGINGWAQVWSLDFSYPLYRSQAANCTFSVGYQHKELHDDFPSLASVEDKASDLLVSAIRFDAKDGWGGGGLTYGTLRSTYGRMNLFGALAATDALTAGKEGFFNKVTLDLARLQALADGFTLYLRYSAQWSDRNLDSSEKLGAGGASAVRSYPLGEANGDNGWIGQVELRYQMGNHTPYVFFDSAHIKSNYRPWDAGSASEQHITGYGVGLRSAYGRWSADLAVAQRGKGEVAQSDGDFGRTAFWASLTRSF